MWGIGSFVTVILTIHIYLIFCYFIHILMKHSLPRFTVTKTYPNLINLLGFHAVFWFFAFMLGIVMIYGIIIMPENKGRSLTTTEDTFTKK